MLKVRLPMLITLGCIKCLSQFCDVNVVDYLQLYVDFSMFEKEWMCRWMLLLDFNEYSTNICVTWKLCFTLEEVICLYPFLIQNVIVKTKGIFIFQSYTLYCLLHVVPFKRWKQMWSLTLDSNMGDFASWFKSSMDCSYTCSHIFSIFISSVYHDTDFRLVAFSRSQVLTFRTLLTFEGFRVYFTRY